MGFYASDVVARDLVGRTVTAIHWSTDVVAFVTDSGPYVYWAVGDCCSSSYLHDFYGVRHLLDNGPILAVDEVDLSPGDPGYHPEECPSAHWAAGSVSPCGANHDVLKVYGLRFTTEHPRFGPVSSVLSFRNDSNGYYGGWLDRFHTDTLPAGMRVLAGDVTGDS